MVYKFKDEKLGTSMEVEAVNEKVQITFYGKVDDCGVDLTAEELQKLINALAAIAHEIRERESGFN